MTDNQDEWLSWINPKPSKTGSAYIAAIEGGLQQRYGTPAQFEARVREDERSKMMDEICNECTQLQHCSQWPWQKCYGNQLAATQKRVAELEEDI